MGQNSLARERVVDPIITAVARGFRSPKAAVANLLFPIVSVAARAGNILTFGPDDFKLVNTIRAPGAATKRVQFGHAGMPFGLVDHRLEAAVPRENQQEALAVPGIDKIAGAVRKVQNMMALERENQAATIARNAANYGASNKVTLTSTDQWDDPSGGDPFGVINAARESIRSQVGEKPNVLTLGPKVLTALRSNPKVLARLSTSELKTPATIAQLEALFEIEKIVEGEAVAHNGTSFYDLWGNDAILAFTTPASAQEQGSPSYGYTYQLEGMAQVEEGYWDDNTATHYFPVSDAYQAVLVGASAGYLIKDAV